MKTKNKRTILLINKEKKSKYLTLKVIGDNKVRIKSVDLKYLIDNIMKNYENKPTH